MAARRPLFYKKEKPRSVSKTGLVLCLLLAGGVMLVPVGGDVAHMAKLRLRDAALSSGLIDFEDCVVTPEHALACSSHAVGTPLPVALRQITDSAAEAAAATEKRLKAENAVRALARDVERLKGELKQARHVESASGFALPATGEVRPTGLVVTNPSTGSMMHTGAEPQPQPGTAETGFSLTPPPEEE